VANVGSFIFLDRRSGEFYSGWDGIANAAVLRPPGASGVSTRRGTARRRSRSGT